MKDLSKLFKGGIKLRFCKQCGYKNYSDNNHCSNCGNEL